MPKAASRSRKPKPLAMFWRRRLTTVLCTRNAPSARTAATNNTWTTMLRTAGFRHGDGRVGRRMVSVAMGRALFRYTSLSSADRHRIHQAAVGPEIVETTVEFELGVLAKGAVEDLAVIADQLDLVIGPFLVEPERLAHARSDTQHALDVGIVALHHVVDVLRGHPFLLGFDQRVDDPADDIVPFVVAVAHDRSKRLLRYPL